MVANVKKMKVKSERGKKLKGASQKKKHRIFWEFFPYGGFSSIPKLL